MKFGETPEEYAQRMQAAPKPLGIMRLRIAELEREVADWKRTCFELVTDGDAVTIAQSLAEIREEVRERRRDAHKHAAEVAALSALARAHGATDAEITAARSLD